MPHIGRPQNEHRHRCQKGEGRADGRSDFSGDVGERVQPHQRAQRRAAHNTTDEHRQPRIRHMDEHDLYGRALLIVVGRYRGLIEADCERTAVTAASHGSARAVGAKNFVGFARSISVMTSWTPALSHRLVQPDQAVCRSLA